MVTVPKPEDVKKTEELKENNTVIMSSPQVKPEDVDIEHDGAEESAAVVAAPRKQKDDPLAEMRKQMDEAEKLAKEEREKRISAENERDAARNQVNTTKENLAKSEKEKIDAQELAISNRVESAKAELVNAKNAWIEAVDTGKPAAVQADLQEKIAEATYKLKGAESAKTHFDTWRENQKNKPAAKAADDGMTPAARSWVDSHPRYNTDKKYRRTAIAAHEDALDDGVKADSDEYFRRINKALVDAGLESDGSAPAADPAPAQKKNNSSGTSTAAPVSHDSTAAGARGGNAAEEQRSGRRTFRLDAQMRDMALKTYGKNSSFKLSDEEAYKRYAAKQLEIRDKRANGERI